MRYFAILLILAVTAFAWVDEDGRDSSIPQGTFPGGGDAITLTILDTFQVSSAGQMLGLDTQDNSDQLVVMDSYPAEMLRAVKMGTGNPAWTLPAPRSFTFGLCHSWPVPYGWYVNCFFDSNMYYYDGTSWSIAFANPAGDDGRGMDFQNDGEYIWQTNASTGIYRIDETGASTFYPVTLSDQMSGLTVFPYNGNLGIFVTCYGGGQDWFLFEFDGSGLTFIGSANPGESNVTG